MKYYDVVRLASKHIVAYREGTLGATERTAWEIIDHFLKDLPLSERLTAAREALDEANKVSNGSWRVSDHGRAEEDDDMYGIEEIEEDYELTEEELEYADDELFLDDDFESFEDYEEWYE